jgi:hypothetical protein
LLGYDFGGRSSFVFLVSERFDQIVSTKSKQISVGNPIVTKTKKTTGYFAFGQ